jgi:site-specific recombinase XerD
MPSDTHQCIHLVATAAPITDNVRKALQTAAKNAGIVGSLGLHQLRHAFCSHALMQGIDPRTVQKWMGHKDLNTTLRYAHVSPDHEREAIQRLRYVDEMVSKQSEVG